MRSPSWLALVPALVAVPALADGPACRTVEVRFAPGAPNLQTVVWIEDAQGNYVDTAFITRLTGQFGLGNRPGTPLLKTDFRWPYGRREMVMPVWAHRRNHHYPKVKMGGVCGWSPQTVCPDNTACGGDCVDSTIAYHPRVSSYEPFYCSPSGASRIDAMSCASKGTFSKGAYDPNEFSLYPPRADLAAFQNSDSVDAKDFANKNDLVAISRATPSDGKLVNPSVVWYPSDTVSDGDYVAWIELSQESDFNAFHNHPNQPDTVSEWDFEGHPFLGQPSIVYRVPFHLDATGWSAITTKYAGYGAWDGSSGTLNPPDGSITVGVPGSGAGRLLDVNDGIDVFRAKVVVGPCDHGDGGVDGGFVCQPPDPITDLVLKATATEIDLSFRSPSGGVAPNRYAVRYREGDQPITDATFDTALAADDQPMPGGPGMAISSTVHGLIPQTSYTVAVRGVAPCGRGGHVVSQSIATPAQKFVTLNGCFVATAAYGSPMASSVGALRKLRDERLLTSAAGRLFVAAYYALSPPFADAIAADRRLRAAARALLQPLVDFATR